MTRLAWLTSGVPTPNDYICRTLRIPNDVNFIANVNGALLSLTEANNWELFGAMTVEETTRAMLIMYEEYSEGSVCMIGAILPYATSDTPNHTLPCDGSTHNRVDYPRLYDRLDAVYIIDDDTFKTPDLRGRAIIGTGEGTGLTARNMGDFGGEEVHVLTEAELAQHAHTTQDHTHTDAGHTHFVPIPTFLAIEPGEAPTYTPVGVPVGGQISSIGNANIIASNVAVNSVGGDDGHENMQPFHAIRYCIVAR